jgi:pimeloyl-ACP methyl ester carboxylesterase
VKQHVIEAGGQQIAWQESTGTGRPVVFVHGNSASARTWEPLLAGPLGARFRCLAFDLPGHGRSPAAADLGAYSLPGYAAVLVQVAAELGAADAIVVGWSLGGHIALEAALAMPAAAGFAIFGTPPVGSAEQMGEAFLPNPAMNVGFAAEVSADEARSYAASFVAPGSGLSLDPFVADILATDGNARASLLASIGAGHFADQVAIVAELRQPLAILQGEGEQLVNLRYLRKLTAPTLWRGEVQLIAGAGHAPQQEVPAEFGALLAEFISDIDG